MCLTWSSSARSIGVWHQSTPRAIRERMSPNAFSCRTWMSYDRYTLLSRVTWPYNCSLCGWEIVFFHIAILSQMQLIVQLQNGVMNTQCVILCHAHHGTRPWSQCWIGLIWSNPSGVTVAADAICPRSLWKSFSGAAVLPLNEFRQFNTDWKCSSVSHTVWFTESNSIPRKDSLHRGEFALFPVDPKSQQAEVTEHHVPVFAQLVPRLCQYQPVIELRMRTPHSLRGTMAASATFVKTRGDRDSPKGRTLYWYARPSNANRRNGMCRRRIETWKYASFRLIAANQSRGRMHSFLH